MYGRANNRRALYCWLAGLAILLFGSACRTVQGTGIIQAEKIKTKTEAARKIVEKYNLRDEDEEALAEIFDEIDKEAVDLGKDRDKEAVKAEENAAEASTWRWVKRGFWAALIAGVAYFLYRFAGKIPFIGKFFGG